MVADLKVCSYGGVGRESGARAPLMVRVPHHERDGVFRVSGIVAVGAAVADLKVCSYDVALVWQT